MPYPTSHDWITGKVNETCDRAIAPGSGADLGDGAAAADEVCVVSVDVGVLALDDVPDHALGRLRSAVHKVLHRLHQARLWVRMHAYAQLATLWLDAVLQALRAKIAAPTLLNK